MTPLTNETYIFYHASKKKKKISLLSVLRWKKKRYNTLHVVNNIAIFAFKTATIIRVSKLKEGQNNNMVQAGFIVITYYNMRHKCYNIQFVSTACRGFVTVSNSIAHNSLEVYASHYYVRIRFVQQYSVPKFLITIG